MRKKIIVDYGISNRIAAKFNVTKVFVSMAMNFKKNSTLARQIRQTAIDEYGGRCVRFGDKKVVNG